MESVLLVLLRISAKTAIFHWIFFLYFMVDKQLEVSERMWLYTGYGKSERPCRRESGIPGFEGMGEGEGEGAGRQACRGNLSCRV